MSTNYPEPEFTRCHYTLTEADRAELKALHVGEEDFEQIERFAAGKIKLTNENGRMVSAKTAIARLGKREFLSGLNRATFHWSCVRYMDDTDGLQYIDFSAHDYWMHLTRV